MLETTFTTVKVQNFNNTATTILAYSIIKVQLCATQLQIFLFIQ